MLYLCHYRRMGAYRISRTRWPHSLFHLVSWMFIVNTATLHKLVRCTETCDVVLCVYHLLVCRVSTVVSRRLVSCLQF